MIAAPADYSLPLVLANVSVSVRANIGTSSTVIRDGFAWRDPAAPGPNGGDQGNAPVDNKDKSTSIPLGRQGQCKGRCGELCIFLVAGLCKR